MVHLLFRPPKCSGSINHFGNIEWRGKVEPSYSNDQLITAAQTQLDIVGTWRVRSSHFEDHVHHIECEQVDDETFRPPLPEESEVHFNFEGCPRKATLPEGTDSIAQAVKAQELFIETLICGPIQHAGDHWEIALTRPRLFPITIIYKGSPTKIWCDNTSYKSIQEEANRVFGCKFAPPSVGHTRSAGPQPLDHRASISRPLPGKKGIQITLLFPTLETTLDNIDVPESATREEIMRLVSQRTKLPILHDDCFAMAPLDWFVHKRITIQYQFPRRDLTALDIISKETFLMGFDPTQPVFIETDGACAGNPGPGGWGTIVSQGDVAVEMHGPDPDTMNNEMESAQLMKH
jgi:hypothetical protein